MQICYKTVGSCRK